MPNLVEYGFETADVGRLGTRSPRRLDRNRFHAMCALGTITRRVIVIFIKTLVIACAQRRL
jgi:hypothetical protein